MSMHYERIVFFLLSLVFVYPVLGATIFKCRNAEGTLFYQEKPCTEDKKSVSSWNLSAESTMDETGVSASGTLVLSQGNNGHYFVDGSINDHFLNFVIDTGASSVALPKGIADTAGLHCIGQVRMETGNGTSYACTTVIQKFRFGNFTLSNVNAIIAPNLNQPLLGMNVLKRFKVEQENGQMRMSRKY